MGAPEGGEVWAKSSRNARRSTFGLDTSGRKPIPVRTISQVNNCKESLIHEQSKNGTACKRESGGLNRLLGQH